MAREKMLLYHKGAINMNEHFSGVQVKNKPLTEWTGFPGLCFVIGQN